jgi:uncharacterized protein YciI
MQFIVIAHDGKDRNALKRRMKVRVDHLKFADEMFKKGRWLYASALLDDDDNMNGSMIVCDFDSREQLEEEWFDKEPYILGDVWEEITITKARVAKHSLKK